MRTTIAAGVALIAMIGVSTVVEADGEEAAPPAEQTTEQPADAPPTTAITIVVPVAEPDAAEPATTAPPEATTASAQDASSPTAPPTTAAATASTASTTDTAVPSGPDEPETTVAGSATTVAAAADAAAPAPIAGAGAGVDTEGSTAPAGSSVATTTNASHDADQETVVTGTQVAVAVSGSNSIETVQPPSGVVADNAAAVAAGDADAIGSRDDNSITQQADVVLSGDAVARILQVALILNIGAALANSGINSIASTPTGAGTGAAITSGDAVAIGNEIASYVTQAATAEASSAIDDATSQLAISLFLGLAIADSGLNSTSGTGTTGSGGAIGTGDAMAIGNDSITDISQRAIALGADAAQLEITQRATVLNLGFALANSGLNEISGVAGGLLAAADAGDDALAHDLFAMLLPALLQSYGYGAGSGSVQSGDATAVGNRSATYVAQVGTATASGDGVAVIDQDVVVANVGGAGANSGGNVLGGRAQTLDPQTATAVVQMAAFLAQLLSMVHSSADAATALASSTRALAIPFGDLILQLDGSFDALDTTVRNGGSEAAVRQVSIVLSLGVAQSNTGLNTTSVISSTRLLAAVNAALPELIATGNVAATNRSLVVICQRINAADVPCLAPPEVEPPVEEPVGQSPQGPATTPPSVATPQLVTPSPAVPTPAAGPGQPHAFQTPRANATLPATGTDTQTILVVAALLVALGGALLLVRRRPAADV
jgi:LPXTG-motif cell wall-anchored protein